MVAIPPDFSGRGGTKTSSGRNRRSHDRLSRMASAGDDHRDRSQHDSSPRASSGEPAGSRGSSFCEPAQTSAFGRCALADWRPGAPCGRSARRSQVLDRDGAPRDLRDGQHCPRPGRPWSKPVLSAVRDGRDETVCGGRQTRRRRHAEASHQVLADSISRELRPPWFSLFGVPYCLYQSISLWLPALTFGLLVVDSEIMMEAAFLNASKRHRGYSLLRGAEAWIRPILAVALVHLLRPSAAVVLAGLPRGWVDVGRRDQRRCVRVVARQTSGPVDRELTSPSLAILPSALPDRSRGVGQ